MALPTRIETLRATHGSPPLLPRAARSSSRIPAQAGPAPGRLWLPDVNDPACRARLAEECRRLARLTPDADVKAGDFAQLAGRSEGWRWKPASIRRNAVVLIRLSRDRARPVVAARSDLVSELSYATALPITSELRADISLGNDIAPTPENGLRAARYDARHHAADG